MPEQTLYTAAQYAALADAQVGKPYVLGADGPSAFDCSGLVLWLNRLSSAWVQPDMTAAGIYGHTKAVTGTPAVGDLVFLRNNPARANGIGHVAVLTKKLSNGDWRIIEARGRASGVVRTTLSYWKTRKYYTGVRRLPAFRLATSTPTPVPSKVTGVNVATYNCLDTRFGGKTSDDVAILRKAAASVYLLTECPEKVRTAIRKGLGGLADWLVWTRDDTKPQAIAFRKAKWQHGAEPSRVTFGPTSYHGGVIAQLTDRVAGNPVQYGSLHLPPRVVASEAKRKSALGDFIDHLDRDLPTIIGGDFNSTAAGGWLRSAGFTVLATGSTTDAGKRYDYLAARGDIGWLGDGTVLNPGSASDHRLVKGKARTTTIPTT
jgi:hypothetical protein